MELEKINKILSELNEHSLGRKFKLVQTDESVGYYSEKRQGEEGEKIVVFDLGEDSLFLKVVYTSDSYGNDNGIKSIRFAKPTTKQVTAYE